MKLFNFIKQLFIKRMKKENNGVSHRQPTSISEAFEMAHQLLEKEPISFSPNK